MEWIRGVRIAFIILTIIYVVIYLNIDKLRREEVKQPLRYTFLGLAWCTGSWGVIGAEKTPVMHESIIALTPFLISSLWLFVKVIRLQYKSK